jgi:hypothetical protein
MFVAIQQGLGDEVPYIIMYSKYFANKRKKKRNNKKRNDSFELQETIIDPIEILFNNQYKYGDSYFMDNSISGGGILENIFLEKLKSPETPYIDMNLKKLDIFANNDTTEIKSARLEIFNDTDIKCTLINTKKESYYKFSTEKTIRIIEQLIDDPDKNIDMNVYNNCCNCICVLWYTKESECNNNAFKYLKSIAMTVHNVNAYLKDFIVRVYLDKSIYDLFTHSTCNDEYKEIFNYIINSNNVEIYSWSCKESTFSEVIRTYRTLCLKDPLVNISIIRDADGFVTKLDAHNINIFANSDKLYYLPDLPSKNGSIVSPVYPRLIQKYNFEIKQNMPQFYLYSIWLNHYVEDIMSYKNEKNINKNTYKYLDSPDFYRKNKPAYNLLCGLFATKIKFTEKYYDECVEKVKAYNFDSYAFDEILLLRLNNFILSYNTTEYNNALFDDIVYSSANNIVTRNIIVDIGDANETIVIIGKFYIILDKNKIKYIYKYYNLENNNVFTETIMNYIDAAIDYNVISTENLLDINIYNSTYNYNSYHYDILEKNTREKFANDPNLDMKLMRILAPKKSNLMEGNFLFSKNNFKILQFLNENNIANNEIINIINNKLSTLSKTNTTMIECPAV